MDKTNPLSKLSENAKNVLLISYVLANRENINGKKLENSVEPKHIFVAILINPFCLGAKVLASMGVDAVTTISNLDFGNAADLFMLKPNTEEILLSSESKDILSTAYSLSSKYNHVYVGTEHLLLAIFSHTEMPFTKELIKAGLNYDSFVHALSAMATYPAGIFSKAEHVEDQNSMIFQIGDDLVELAKQKKLDPVIGREKEIDQIINVLSRRKKNNAIIVGEAGVGKTAIVEGIAQKISDGAVPSSLSSCRIVSIDIPTIVAGSKMRGDVEEKVIQIINEVVKNPNIIVFIDEIHNILMTGLQGGGVDISSILKPALVSGRFRCIGATTSEDYSRYFEEDSALTRRFQPVFVNEPTIEDSIKILSRIKPVLEKHHNIDISNEAVISSVKLSDRYVSDRYLPDKAIDLLDEATAYRKLEVEVRYKTITRYEKQVEELNSAFDTAVIQGKFIRAKLLKGRIDRLKDLINKSLLDREITQHSKKYEVGSDTVKKIVAKWTDIPVETIDDNESSRLLNLEKDLKSRIIGQNEAVKNVANAIKRARAGISSAKRPWASFLFLGPTGVGKSELAKVLTHVLFGREDRMVQIDMSEMMEMHSVSKLIGSPPGYIGYREGGQLTEAVRKNPHCVLLFDEIEKAHPDVLNVLLQILEYGHLTDGKGRRVNFTNTIIVLTSNIGAEEIRRSKILGFVDKKNQKENRGDMEKVYQTMKDQLLKELKETLRPELLNRLDDVVIFRSLTRKDLEKIVQIMINELNERLKDQHVFVKLDDSAVNYIIKEGYSEEYGARPIRRILQDKVESIVADKILSRSQRKTKGEEIFTITKKGRSLIIK